jgi:hypothetical protein
MEASTTPAPAPLTSVLAMAATLRGKKCTPGVESLHDLHRQDPVVPVYEVSGATVAEEATSALRVLDYVGDRLRRLHAAYGEWHDFDAGAYFDLSHAQAHRLVRVSERASTVHVTFFADLLLPSFRGVEHYWFYDFCPSYWKMTDALRNGTEPAEPVREFARQVQPEMIAKWSRLCDVVRQAHVHLYDDQGYLVAYLCQEERARWQLLWKRQPASSADPLIRSEIDALPTLTLSTEFPLPASRQPGRLRRLRNNRARRSPSWFLHWRSLDG